ncbi:MAG: MarR family transcriptional regulator [Anditalea sp.]
MTVEEAIKLKIWSDPYSKAVVNLLYTHSYIVSEQNKLFKPHGISPEQYNVLRILRGQHTNPISVSSIQEGMLNKMSNASRLVEKLKQKGLVVRKECPSDRRQVDVSITPMGLKLLASLENEVKQFNRQTIHLKLGEVKTLNDLLDGLRS